MTTPEKYRFALYLAGKSPNGQKTLSNLREFCEQLLPEQYEIEVIDVLQNPGRALEERILVTPTVLRVEPEPVERVIGTLSDQEKFEFLLTSSKAET